MSDIFLSYAREDRERVRPLVEALQAAGWSVWWDFRIRAGDTFDDLIERQLAACRCVVVAWSVHSVGKRWVRAEAAEGLERNILVPVLIDRVKIPIAFKLVQAADLVDWQCDTASEPFHRLIDDLSGLLGEPPVQANQTLEPKPQPTRRATTAGRRKPSSRALQAGAEPSAMVAIEPEMVRIRGGTFLMGSPEPEAGRYDNEGQHQVEVEDFTIGKYPVTFDEYDRFCDVTGRDKPSDEGWGRGRRPAINVSWQDAFDYAEWLSRQTGKRYRLPTEAEWEYAARGDTATAYWWGGTFDPAKANNGSATTPVGQYPENPFGLHDSAGNVWEWTGSLYVKHCGGAEMQLAGRDETGLRVVRGGSWGTEPRNLRSASRLRSTPDYRGNNVGFRLAQD